METNIVIMHLDEYNELLIKANKYDELINAKEFDESVEKYRPEISG